MQMLQVRPRRYGMNALQLLTGFGRASTRKLANCLLLTSMKSMTGFGKGSASGEGFNVTAEIKTVNNRYLDVHLRVGQELASLEVDIRKRISARLSRGRVDLS